MPKEIEKEKLITVNALVKETTKNQKWMVEKKRKEKKTQPLVLARGSFGNKNNDKN